MIGQTINGYTISRKLGEGGMSVVYYAQNRIGKPAAIKVLNDECSKDPDIRKRFRQEAEIMLSLNDIPGICRVEDFAELPDGKLALVMEYLEGINLKEWVTGKGKMEDSDMIRKICRQVLSSLGEAHKRGIIHRDIKPSNLFRTKDGRIVIMDFGISKMLYGNSEGATEKETTTRRQMGTLSYMSPEQIKCTAAVDRRADIYSFGLTLYFLLTGNDPLDMDDDSLTEIKDIKLMEAIRHATRKSIDKRTADCEQFLNEILQTEKQSDIITNDINFTGIFEEGLKWYYGTDGCSVDLEKAFRCFKRAAEGGLREAQYKVGKCYINGEGVVQNDQEAAKWLEFSAQQGDSDAQYMLGRLKETGDGIEKDVTQAVNLFQKSADQGNVRGMYRLGMCYFFGKGVKLDLFKAKKCFHEAAKQGDSDAQYVLGWCYYNGSGAVVDYVEAAKWFDASAGQGNPKAMNDLGRCYEKGKGVTKNKETALKYYRQASELGHEVATENYNRLSKDDGCYITTAICQYYNKPDNCYELTRLRWFRDNWLQYQEQGKALIDEYYKTAPSMVAVINRDAEKDKVYGVLNGYISRCISFIEEEKYDRTQQEYMAMINYLQMRYR